MRLYHLPPHLQAIIFDIDSTLYTNKEYAIYQNDIQIRHFARLEGMDYEEAVQRVAHTRSQWSAQHGGQSLSLGNTFCLLGHPIEESIRWREELLEPEQFLCRDERLRASLEALSHRFRLACLTNNPVLVGKKTLAALGVEHLVPLVIGLDSCQASKPHPAPFLLALEKLHCPPEHCLAVGDRYHIDLALPLELGMGGILVEGVEDVYRLPALLTETGSAAILEP